MIQWFLRLFVLDRVIMRWLFRLRAEGLERLPEEDLFVLTPKPHQLPRPVRGAAALGYRRLRRTEWAGWTGAAFGNPLTERLAGSRRRYPSTLTGLVFRVLPSALPSLSAKRTCSGFLRASAHPPASCGRLNPASACRGTTSGCR